MTMTMIDAEATFGDIISDHFSVAPEHVLPAGVDRIEKGYLWPMAFQSSGGRNMTATLYPRFNDSIVLRVETVIGQAPDNDYLHRWVSQVSGCYPFVSVKVEPRAAEMTVVSALHTMRVDTVTADLLVEVVSSIEHQADQWKVTVEAFEWPEAQLRNAFSTGRFVNPEDSTVVVESDSVDGDDDLEPDFLEEDDPFGFDDNRITKGGNMTVHSAHDVDEVNRIIEQLQSMVGLENVKVLVKRLVAQQRIGQARAAYGLPTLVSSPHLVFSGNPGTGKTTVARLIGKLYKALGLLEYGHVVEVNRSSLIAGYVGQTAIKTAEKCTKALGGVLFIDEAYSLADHGSNDYGSEAIETIMTFMENNRGQIAVVVAGYTNLMARFLDANPGLRSRFDHTLPFEDYTNEELVQIFDDLATEYKFELTGQARDEVARVVGAWDRSVNFANARDVRRLLFDVFGAHSEDVMAMERIDRDVLCRIDAAHIRAAERMRHTGPQIRRPGYL